MTVRVTMKITWQAMNQRVLFSSCGATRRGLVLSEEFEHLKEK